MKAERDISGAFIKAVRSAHHDNTPEQTQGINECVRLTGDIDPIQRAFQRFVASGKERLSI